MDNNFYANVQLGDRNWWAWIRNDGGGSDWHPFARLAGDPKDLHEYSVRTHPSNVTGSSEALERIVKAAYALGLQDGKQGGKEEAEAKQHLRTTDSLCINGTLNINMPRGGQNVRIPYTVTLDKFNGTLVGGQFTFTQLATGVQMHVGYMHDVPYLLNKLLHSIATEVAQVNHDTSYAAGAKDGAAKARNDLQARLQELVDELE